MWKRIDKKLRTLYAKEGSLRAKAQLQRLASDFKHKEKTSPPKKSYASSCLITYADTIQKEGESPLSSLNDFVKEFEIAAVFETIHILPFYSWDTDRGFSVKNYYEVDKRNGTWKDILSLAKKINLMFDFVANHASIDNPLVQYALIERHLDKNDPRYEKYSSFKDFVIAYSLADKPSEKNLKVLVRPRPTPVLTKYYISQTKNGELKAVLGETSNESDLINTSARGWVWTTFSRSKEVGGTEATRQVDLNFANPNVLIETAKIILFYAARGGLWIRLDAIGYIWKKLGSTSIHEKEAHTIISILSDFLRIAAPNLLTVSEVNESQEKAIEYLGTKDNPEADLFYQFSHFPLAVYAMLSSNSLPYKKWVATLPESSGRQFTTVLGSHDGMGLKPVRQFLNQRELDWMIKILTTKHGALCNYSELPGNKKIVYEVCATAWNLINPTKKKASDKTALRRYLSVLALGLLQKGTPAIYINGLLGSSNYLPVRGLDENRSINREIFSKSELESVIKNPKTQIGMVFPEVVRLLKLRKELTWFDPLYPQAELIESESQTLMMLLTRKDSADNLLSVTNFRDKKHLMEINSKLISKSANIIQDVIYSNYYPVIKNEKIYVSLLPFQTAWLIAGQ